MNEVFEITYPDPDIISTEKSIFIQRLKQIAPDFSPIEVGSTAISGLIGKNDIDYLIYAPPKKFEKLITLLSNEFEDVPNQTQNSYYRAFKFPSKIDIAIQCTSDIKIRDKFLKFLNIMKTNTPLRQKYSDLKLNFDKRPMKEYRKEKERFIQEILST